MLRLVKGYSVPTEANLNRRFMDRFLIYKSGKRPRTLTAYDSAFKIYLRFAGASWPPSPDLVGGFVHFCRKSGYAENSTHNYFRVIKTWCNWLYRAGHISANPIPLVDAPSQPRQRVPRAPKDEVIDRFFGFLESRVEQALRLGQLMRRWEWVRDLALYSLMFDTGVRVGEAASLEMADIDLALQTVHLRETKDGDERTVPFGKRCRGDLALWWDVRDQIEGVPKSLRAVFLSRERKRTLRGFTHWGIRQRITRLCRAAHIPRFTPHQLRHAYAGQSLANGASLEDLRENMGHSDLKTTSIYTLMHIEKRIERARQTSPRSNQSTNRDGPPSPRD